VFEGVRPVTGTEVTLLAVVVGLIAMLFVLSLAEASLLHVRRSAVAVAAERGDGTAKQLLGLLDDLPRVMNAVLFAVLLSQVIAATAAGALARSWFGSTGVTVATVLITLVLFVYAEAIPKTIAVRDPLKIGRRLATTISRLVGALRWPVSAVVWLADVQSPGSGISTVSAVSEDELLHLADEAAAAGNIESSDAELIERSFSFGDIEVEQVSVALRDVVSVASDATVADSLRVAIDAGHRRLPVYEGSRDQIVGFVRLRDLAEAATGSPGALVATRMRPLLTVSQDQLIVGVLRAMQLSAIHIAVVVGNQERPLGIVTVEDLVEELVGAIDEG
jgi:putative hemolysin